MASLSSLPTITGRADFWPLVAQAPHLGLLLDYDGTLAPFHIDRYQAVPYPGIAEVITALRDNPHITLRLVSGRSALEVAGLLDVERVEVSGAHGYEHLTPTGELLLLGMPEGGSELLRDAAAAAATLAPLDRVEVKSASVAVHLRGLAPSDADALGTAVVAAWEPLETHSISEVRHFNGGFEFRVRGRNKGDAVRDVLSDLPKGGIGLFFGDDETDEDAFVAIKDHGIGVLVSTEERKTFATGRIDSPAVMLEVLRAIRDTFDEEAETQPARAAAVTMAADAPQQLQVTTQQGKGNA